MKTKLVLCTSLWIAILNLMQLSITLFNSSPTISVLNSKSGYIFPASSRSTTRVVLQEEYIHRILIEVINAIEQHNKAVSTTFFQFCKSVLRDKQEDPWQGLPLSRVRGFG